MADPTTVDRRPTVRELIRANPEARRRLGWAYAWLLLWMLGAIVAIAILAIWLLTRRARRIREGLARPRPVRWPSTIEPAGDDPS